MEECCNKEEKCCKENSVTEESVANEIASEEFMTVGKKTTLCVITLKNGFECVGSASCVDAANYDLEVGKPFARDRALQMVWMHLGSILQERLAGQVATAIEGTEPMDGAAA